MTLDEYQKLAIKTDVYGGSGDLMSDAFMIQVLGLVGEAGEFADKIKKLRIMNAKTLSEKERQEILKELGDVLWYLSSITHYLGESLNSLGEANISKLQDRKKRNVIIKSAGDNR